MTFALIVKGKYVPTYDGKIMTQEGDPFLVLNDNEGWVPATSIRYKPGKLPADTKIFKSKEIAENFAKNWKGHPWWCVPNGEFKIIKVKIKYRKVVEGYEEVFPSF